MGCSKLREWVGTVTGKGDRWGRDRLGRSAPAFMAASTTALPPPTCTARREAGQLCRRLLFCCEAGQLLAVVLRPVPGGESAGCVCLQCLVLRAFLFACLVHSAFAMPTAHLILPRSIHFALPLFIPCAPGSVSKPTCLQAARLSRRQQQRGSAVAARAPCCVHHTVTGAARLPVGSRNMGTAFEQPMRRCPLRRKKGRPGTAFGQRPSSPHLHFVSQRLHVSSLAPC